MSWAECLADQFSSSSCTHGLNETSGAVLAETDPSGIWLHSMLAREYAELKASAHKNYSDFDWEAWVDATNLVQAEAKSFYAKTLLSDDFQTISKAYSLDIDLAQVLTFSRQLLNDFGDRIIRLNDELHRVQQQDQPSLSVLPPEPHNELRTNVLQLVSAWKEFLLHISTLEELSSDLKLAYSIQAFHAAKDNKEGRLKSS